MWVSSQGNVDNQSGKIRLKNSNNVPVTIIENNKPHKTDQKNACNTCSSFRSCEAVHKTNTKQLNKPNK